MGETLVMPETSSRRPALVGAVAFGVVSWGLAAAFVAAQDEVWSGSGDLRAFAFWSLLLVVPAYGVLRAFDRRFAAWRPAPTFLAAAMLGALAGLASTFLVSLILGSWIGVFDFPVFLCWLTGSLVAFVAVALMRRPASWPFALSAVTFPIVGVVAVLRVVSAQPSDLLIHLKPGASPQHIQTVWTEVLGTPHPSGRGFSGIESVASASQVSSGAEPRIRVTFQPGTSAARRAEVVQRVLASPLVAGTSDLDPGSN